MRVQRTNGTNRMAAAAIIALATAATAAHAQNLLVNGDFEQFTPGDDYNIPGWQQAAAGGARASGELGAHYDNSFSTGEYAHTTGGRSFKTYSPPAQYGGSVGEQYVPVTAGQTYTFSGFWFSPSADFIQSPDFAIAGFGFRTSANNPAGAVGTDQELHFGSDKPADQWLPFSFTALAPAGATYARVVIGDIKIGTTTLPGAVYYDDLSLTKAVVTNDSTWIATGSGGWLTGSNWQNGVVPNAVGAAATFAGSITAPSTVTIASAGVTAGALNFNNAANAYTIGGTGNLTLDVASGNAALNVTAGSHSITAPIVMNDATVATVASGQTLTIGGPLNLNGLQLSTAGTNAGTLRINASSVTASAGSAVRANGGTVQVDVDLGNNVDVGANAGQLNMSTSQHVHSLVVAAGGKATLSDVATPTVIRTPTLSVAPGGTLNLGDNAAIIEYTGTSPAATIRASIKEGRTGNNAGTGIISSKAAANSKYSVGYAESVGGTSSIGSETGYDSTTLLLRVTLNGDADLNGAVQFSDLVSLAQNYNGSGKTWQQGDFNYDDSVNFADLVALAQNYNASVGALQAAGLSASFQADWALAQSLVPEPTTLAAGMGAATLLMRRRNRAAR